MCTPKAPAAPDPAKVASAQTGQSVGTAIANTAMGQVNQVTPDGSITYKQSGTYAWTDPNSGKVYNLPQYTATTELSADARALRDANNRGQLTLANLGADQAARAGDLLSRPMDTSTLPQMADRSGDQPVQYGADLTAPGYDRLTGDAGLTTDYQNDFSADRKRVEDALFERLNPQLDRSRSNLETSLANRGIKLGSAAYDRALEESNKAANDARISTVLAGGQEQSRLTELARQEAEFGNNARQQTYANNAAQVAFNNGTTSQSFADQQAIQGRRDNTSTQQFSQRQQIADALDRQRSQAMQEQFAIRSAPINEITALLSGSQVATPQFGVAAPSQMATTDIAGIQQQGYANQMAAYQQKLAQQQAMMGGLFGLGSSALLGGAFSPQPRTN